MKRLILPILAGAAIVYSALCIVRTQAPRVTTNPPVRPPQSEFADTIAAVGIIEPSTESVAIGTPLAGVVEDVSVQVGDSVKQGDALFKLEDRQLKAELGVRQAALAAAQAKVTTVEATRSDAKDQLDRATKLTGGSVISQDELMRRKYAQQVAEAKLREAAAEVASAEAQIRAIETEIERCVVRAPIAADVLQVKVRAGEFAPAGQTAKPLLVLGRLHPLHVRVDVDEHEGWRVREAAGATGTVRGNAGFKAQLKFVRFEPMVIPKQSLTGDSSERVDTRVLQVIYEVPDTASKLFVGQQMDVFIDDISARDKASVHFRSVPDKEGRSLPTPRPGGSQAPSENDTPRLVGGVPRKSG